MKFVIQRVTHASVTVEEKIVGEIEKGFLVLIGVGKQDTEKEADYLVKKLTGLRIFEDENGKTNLSLKDVGGSLLLISQFTLYANCKSTKFYRSGRSKTCREIIRIYYCAMQRKNRKSRNWNFWSGNESKFM